MNHRTAVTAVTACLIAALGAVIDAAPADAAARTLVSGTYFTSTEWRTLLDVPTWVPTARPGSYRTTGRPAKRTCSVRAFDVTGAQVTRAFLAKATSYTARIPETAVWVDVTGPCVWHRQ